MVLAYLSGPEIFLPQALELGEKKKIICAQYRLTGIFPLDGLDLGGLRGKEKAAAYAEHTTLLLKTCDVIIPNYTPFRGPSLAPHVAKEVGFMEAQGGRIYPYSNDPRPYRKRVQQAARFSVLEEGVWRDRERLEIEDYGLAEAAALWAPAYESGVDIVTPTLKPADYYGDLTSFEKVARAVAADHAPFSRPGAPKPRLPEPL